MTDFDLFGEPVAPARVARVEGDWLPGVQASVIADGVRRRDAAVHAHAAVMADALEGDGRNAYAIGAAAATDVYSIGGRCERVAGVVIGHRYSRRTGLVCAVDLRTESHGVLVVDLGKLEVVS